MYTPDREKKKKAQPVLSIRISREAKAALAERAKLRSKAEARTVKPGEVARDLIVYALQETNPARDDLTFEEFLLDVLAACLFSRRALELVLSEHDGLADRLFRACRAEVTRRVAGRRLWRMT